MTMSATEKLLSKAKFLTQILGINPLKQTIFSKIYIALYTCLYCLFFTLCIIKAFKVFGNITTFTIVMESLTVFIHGGGKLIACMSNQKRLAKLFTDTDSFWPVPPQVAEDCEKIRKYFQFFINYFLFMGNLVMVLFFLNSLLSDSGELPLVVFIPAGWPKSLISVSVYGFSVIIVEMILVCDLLFVSLCACVVIQLRIFNHAVASLDFSKKMGDDFKIVIKQHGFILDEIGKSSTYAFFAEYAVCTLTTCFELYLVSEISQSENLNFYDAIRGFIYVLTLTFELTLYCVTAEVVSAQVDQISKSIYTTNWHCSNKLEDQKNVILFLMRNNRQQAMKAGGVVLINMPTFLVVFKTAFSFYTCLKAVAS